MLIGPHIKHTTRASTGKFDILLASSIEVPSKSAIIQVIIDSVVRACCSNRPHFNQVGRVVVVSFKAVLSVISFLLRLRKE